MEVKPRISNGELPAIINRAELFALVSRFEGHAKTMLEAMACGAPVLGSKTTGIAEEISHGRNGHLCTTDARSIADGIVALRADGAAREEMGRQARRWVEERYSVAKVLEMELDIIERLLA